VTVLPPAAPASPPAPVAGAAVGELAAIPANPLRALFSPAMWAACVHMLSDGVAAVAGLGVLVLILVSACLVPVGLVGVPLLGGACWLLGVLGAAERARFALTLGVLIPAVHRARPFNALRHPVGLILNRTTWRQVGYFLTLMPVSVITVTTVVAVWSVPPTLSLLPLYYTRLPSGHAQLGGLVIAGLPAACAVSAAALLVLLVVSPSVVHLLSRMDATLGRVLLGPATDAGLAERVEALTVSRRRVVDAAALERARIERDLHDGAQQRLTSVAMTLGLAKSRLGENDESGVGELVDEAHRDAKQAIAELRDLTRGLHPPVLTDRGLDAALSAVAARAPLPVSVDVHATPRPSPTIEATAYFVVSEALTNVAKHADASRAWVTIRRDGDQLALTVRDDGCGGAQASRGGGLAGLADRVGGVDGQLAVHSPSGGPTVLEVRLPCGS